MNLLEQCITKDSNPCECYRVRCQLGKACVVEKIKMILADLGKPDEERLYDIREALENVNLRT